MRKCCIQTRSQEMTIEWTASAQLADHGNQLDDLMVAGSRDFLRPGCKYVTNHHNGLPQAEARDLMVLIRGLDKSELKVYVLCQLACIMLVCQREEHLQVQHTWRSFLSGCFPKYPLRHTSFIYQTSEVSCKRYCPVA